MSRYVSNATVPELAERITAARRIMLTTHAKPDGDGMGASLALARALAPKGKVTDIFLMGPLDPSLRVVAGDTPFHMVTATPAVAAATAGGSSASPNAGSAAASSANPTLPGDDYDLAIVTDTGAWSQLEPLGPWLQRHHDHVIGLDHHAHGDDVASMRIVEPSAASTTQLLVLVLDELGCELTGGIGGVAEALFVGLATDTGWFRYPIADVEAFQVAARLLAAGVDKSRLYQIIEEQYRPQRLALQARALASVEYVRGGAVAMMSLRREDFEETGASEEDLTSLINAPMSIGSVRVSVLLAETAEGRTKISFRSKPTALDVNGSPQAGGPWDVNALAGRFGGGGHIHAAGARVDLSIEEARRAVLREVMSDER